MNAPDANAEGAMMQSANDHAENSVTAPALPTTATETSDKTETVDSKAELDRLAALDPFEYERERTKAATRLKVRVSKLDEAVAQRRRQLGSTPSTAGSGSPLELQATEPWPEPVEGNALADEAIAAIERHCILPDGGAVAMMLWSTLAHGFDLFDHSPRLGFNSPEKRCGKTTALAIVGELVPRALSTANITPAALFRAVELARPTLLIDEADTFLNGKDELRGILNSGHSRTSGFVVRTVGEDFEPRRFTTWAPACIAMIGKPPATLADRSILIPMRRKAVSEHAERLRREDCAYLNQLARKMARWIEDHRVELEAADPDIPERLNDRAADNWRPLLAIADTLGGDGRGGPVRQLFCSRGLPSMTTTLARLCSPMFGRSSTSRAWTSCHLVTCWNCWSALRSGPGAIC